MSPVYEGLVNRSLREDLAGQVLHDQATGCTNVMVGMLQQKRIFFLIVLMSVAHDVCEVNPCLNMCSIVYEAYTETGWYASGWHDNFVSIKAATQSMACLFNC